MSVLTSPNGATLCTLPGLPSSGMIPLASTQSIVIYAIGQRSGTCFWNAETERRLFYAGGLVLVTTAQHRQPIPLRTGAWRNRPQLCVKPCTML